MKPISMSFRLAKASDLTTLVAMLADDALGATREIVQEEPAQCYRDAFAAIESDPNQQLLIAESAGRIVGCLQLSFIPGLSRRGAWRGQIESVRIASDARGGGLGRVMLDYAISLCRERECAVVQLTTDKSRAQARRFYEQLGFVASHEGMKLDLASA
ncbi:MAG: GNAT family N-acetyltransferase [Gammaproteobacteria bacterium]|nr:MAG: GNAT family N-acetyltransferase [Gammaproteobacteria bacterium]